MAQASVLALSAVVSAVTSGVVTLGIEWAAKPSLEARKERLLARHRCDAEIRRQLLRIRECAIRLSKAPRMSDMGDKERSVLRSEWNNTADRLEVSARLLDESMSDLYPEKSGEVYSVLTGYFGLVVGTLNSSRSWVYKGKQIGTATQAVYAALSEVISAK